MQDLLPWMAPWGVWSLYLLMFIAGGTLLWLGWFGRRFHDQPRCPRCGYDRTGLPTATCPECGYVVTRPWEPYTSRRRRHALLLLGLLVAAALPCVAVTRRVRVYGWDYYRRFGPVYWMFPTQTVWSYSNGEYRVTCVRDPAQNWANSKFYGPKLRIMRGGATVLEFEDSDSLCMETTPSPGTDLNANGSPEIVLRFDSNGSGAYQTYRVVELGPGGHVVVSEFYTRGSGTTANFLDLNGDGIYEIYAADWVYDGDRSHPVASGLVWDGNQFARRPYYTCRRPPPDDWSTYGF